MLPVVMSQAGSLRSSAATATLAQVAGSQPNEISKTPSHEKGQHLALPFRCKAQLDTATSGKLRILRMYMGFCKANTNRHEQRLI